MRRQYTLVFFFLLVPVVGSAQSLFGETQFQRQLDAVLWRQQSTFLYENPAFDLSLSNRLGSRFFLLGNQAQNIQNDRQTDLSISTLMIPGIAFAADVRSFEYTSTKTRQDVALAGIEFRPGNLLFLRTQLGVMSDSRSRSPDQGFIYGLKAWTPDLQPADGFRLSPSLFLEIADIQPRKYVTTRYEADMGYQNQGFQLDAALQHGISRREGYLETNTIESIRIDTTLIRFRSRFPIAKRWTGELDVEALNHLRLMQNRTMGDISDVPLFNSRTLRQAVDTRVLVSRQGERLRSTLGMAIGVGIRDSRLTDTEDLPPDQVRRRSEILTNSNFTQNRFELFTNQDMRLSDRHVMSVFTSASILRYDTPESNPDDRDELSLLFRTTNRFRFSDTFETVFTTAGEAYHYVYLFAERSIENNWRRSLRLMPEFIWQPTSAIYWRTFFLIRANYTVEDYELEGRQNNDQSARELVMSTDVDYRFIPNWHIGFQGSRSELRIGKLFWKEFRELPIDTLITYDGKVEIRKVSGFGEIAVGMRYFHKTDFLIRATQTIPMEGGDASRTATGLLTTVQFGPVVRILWPFGSGQEIHVQGWYQVQETRTKLYTTYPDEVRAAFLRAERKPVTRVFPNIDMTVRFRF